MEQSRQDIFDNLEEIVKGGLELKTLLDSRKRRNNIVWDATKLPTGSHYAPVYVKLLRDLENRRKINPHKHILVETTTGNAGAAFGFVASFLGYTVLIFMPADMPDSRIDHVKKFLGNQDSKVILTPSKKYVKGMVDYFQDFYKKNKFNYQGKELYAVNHSVRIEAIEAIRNSVRYMIDRKPKLNIHCAVLALGNGTSSTGIASVLKEYFPKLKVIGVEPKESPWCYVQKMGIDNSNNQTNHQHQIYGTGGWGVNFPNLDLNCIDEIKLISESDWKRTLKQLHGDNQYVGHSTAACQSVIGSLDKELSTFSVVYDNYGTYQ